MDGDFSSSTTSWDAWAQAIVDGLQPALLAQARSWEAAGIIAPTAQEMVERFRAALPPVQP